MFSGKEIKALAKDGNVLPDTVIETEDGKQFHARGIVGIEFWDGGKTETPETKNTSNIDTIPVPPPVSAQSANTTNSDDHCPAVFFSTRLLPVIFLDYPKPPIKPAYKRWRLMGLDKAPSFVKMLGNKVFLYLSAVLSIRSLNP
jgi:hypothetical protein